MGWSDRTSEFSERYPATLDIDPPDHPLDRVSTFFRPLFAIPIAVILALVNGATAESNSRDHVIGAGGIIFVATALMIAVRRKYPRWWYDWNVALTNFGLRVGAYLALLTDVYPATDAEQGVHVALPYPDVARELHPWLPLVKWLLAVPHYVVLAFLTVGLVFAVVFAWIAILFTGAYPRGLFDYVVGVLRWWLRVSAYAFLLITDRYPPFRLKA